MLWGAHAQAAGLDVETVGAQSPFDWKQAKGAKIEVNLQKSPRSDQLQAHQNQSVQDLFLQDVLGRQLLRMRGVLLFDVEYGAIELALEDHVLIHHAHLTYPVGGQLPGKAAGFERVPEQLGVDLRDGGGPEVPGHQRVQRRAVRRA